METVFVYFHDAHGIDIGRPAETIKCLTTPPIGSTLKFPNQDTDELEYWIVQAIGNGKHLIVVPC